MMFLSLLDYRLNVRFVEYLKKNKQVDDSNALSCLYVEYLKQRRTNKSRKKGAEEFMYCLCTDFTKSYQKIPNNRAHPHLHNNTIYNTKNKKNVEKV